MTDDERERRDQLLTDLTRDVERLLQATSELRAVDLRAKHDAALWRAVLLIPALLAVVLGMALLYVWVI